MVSASLTDDDVEVKINGQSVMIPPRLADGILALAAPEWAWLDKRYPAVQYQIHLKGNTPPIIKATVSS